MNITMQSIYRGITYIAIICFTVSFMYWVSPPFVPSPHGILLPSKNTRPPIDSNSVRVFPFAPMGYQRLGTLNIKLYAKREDEHVRHAVIKYAKQLAAKVGANGIVVEGYGKTPGNISGPGANLYVFQGLAIYLPVTSSVSGAANEY